MGDALLRPKDQLIAHGSASSLNGAGWQLQYAARTPNEATSSVGRHSLDEMGYPILSVEEEHVYRVAH